MIRPHCVCSVFMRVGSRSMLDRKRINDVRRPFSILSLHYGFSSGREREVVGDNIFCFFFLFCFVLQMVGVRCAGRRFLFSRRLRGRSIRPVALLSFEELGLVVLFLVVQSEFRVRPCSGSFETGTESGGFR